uniref:Uncharacterized protein n=1 Tax=Athene cunicularia TaxID=194338 RepID=A0A663MI06_ATHCN
RGVLASTSPACHSPLVSSGVHPVVKSNKEIVGTLQDELVSKDVTEFENTPEGRRITKLDQILKNGNNRGGVLLLTPLF